MTYNILITESIADRAVDHLRESGECNVELAYGVSDHDLLGMLGEVDALIVRSGTNVTASTIAAGPRLRVLARAGSGVDNIDVAAATARGIAVTNAPDANTNAAAEMAIGLMLALSRNVGAAHRALAEGRWERSTFIGSELRGRTAGIVGYGRVGRLVGALCAAMGMQVVAYDTYPGEPTASRRVDELEELLAIADIVTLHAATEDGKPLIDAGAIATMKQGALLVNVARGYLVDSAALADALDRGHLRGAAIDVYEQEPPPPDHPLVGHPGGTPHAAPWRQHRRGARTGCPGNRLPDSRHPPRARVIRTASMT